jgi:hypothetical protein
MKFNMSMIVWVLMFFGLTTYQILSNDSMEKRTLSHEALLASANADETLMVVGMIENSNTIGISEIDSLTYPNIREEVGYFSVSAKENSSKSYKQIVLYDLEKNPWRTYYFEKKNQKYALVDIMNF